MKKRLIYLLILVTAVSCQSHVFLKRKYVSGRYVARKEKPADPFIHPPQTFKNPCLKKTQDVNNLTAPCIIKSPLIDKTLVPKEIRQTLPFQRTISPNKVYKKHFSRTKKQTENGEKHLIAKKISDNPILSFLKIIFAGMLVASLAWLFLVFVGALLGGEMTLGFALIFLLAIVLVVLYIKSLFR